MKCEGLLSDLKYSVTKYKSLNLELKSVIFLHTISKPKKPGVQAEWLFVTFTRGHLGICEARLSVQ